MRIALHWQILIGMVLGAAVGLGLNFSVGARSVEKQEKELPPGVVKLLIDDTPNKITIEITESEIEMSDDGTETTRFVTRRRVVDGTGKTKGAVPTLKKLMVIDPAAHQLFLTHGRSWSRWVGDQAQAMGNLFLRLLRMVAVPLIVTSLITGVMGLGDAGRLGRMFSHTLLYYLTTSLLAITIGLLMVNLIRPGLTGQAKAAGEGEAEVSGDLGKVLFEQLENMIPPNPVSALADSNFLSIISFSLAFAIFAILVGGEKARRLRELFEAAFEVMMAMTMAIIRLAPFGVLCMMLSATATQGPDVFKSLFWYMLAVVCALTMHAVIILPAILFFVARRHPWQFARAMSPALLTAFSSASSNGTLPLTLASVEQRAGVNNKVSSFVLPLGATINMDGTALYEAVAVLFIAQLYHGENLPLTQQIIVAITALLASVGAAGIPHAGLVMMTIILQAVKLPIEMQGIILAVDRVLDMCRTMVNVWSDSCGCAVIDRLQGPDESEAGQSKLA